MYEERFGYKRDDGVLYTGGVFFENLARKEHLVDELLGIDRDRWGWGLAEYLGYCLCETVEEIPAGCVQIYWGPDSVGEIISYEKFAQCVRIAADIWIENHNVRDEYTLGLIDNITKRIAHRYDNGIKKVGAEDAETVCEIAQKTIAAVYPHYYPRGAVEFFSKHHCMENVREDFKKSQIYLYCVDKKPVGTVTVHGNEITRLFVLPEYQGKGYGKALMDFAEEMIWDQEKYDNIHIDASLPAKRIYLKRGYKEKEYNIIEAGEDFLCYDIMELE